MPCKASDTEAAQQADADCDERLCNRKLDTEHASREEEL